MIFTFSFRLEILHVSEKEKKQYPLSEETFFGVSPLIATSTVSGFRDFERAINGIFLSLNLIGRGQKKRNDVPEIVSQLEIADAIFGEREATTGNTPAVRRILRF